MAFKSSNTQEFILKAEKVHGHKYDYSKVDYVKSSLKVIIICKLHGEFLQTPSNHLKGTGCPICSRNIKYTKEVCLKEAQKYMSRRDFRENSPKIYDTACTKHWIDEICSHMPGKIKRKAGWWNNIDNCIATASLYSSPQELMKAEKGCYASISIHKWQDICYKHMTYRTREYSIKQLRQIAKSCKSHREFRDNFSGAYSSAKKKGIYNEICSHMPPLRIVTKGDIPLTFENCRRIANGFKSRSEFQKCENGRWYKYAVRNNILEEVCEHMPRKGNKKKRCIYAAEFDDNCVYIGLTYFAERRWSDHLRAKDSTVYKHIENTGLTPQWKRLTDYIDYQKASRQEGVWKDKYAKNGWTILNKAKTGSLGGDGGYTLEEVLKEASKYETLPEFFKGSPGHYQRAYRSGWMKEVRNICKSKWREGFSEVELRDIFSRFNNITELRKYRHAAIDAANKLGILEELTRDYVVKPGHHYKVERFTEQELFDIARRYKYRSEFKKGNTKAYHNARSKGILDKVCAHMEKKPVQPKVSLPRIWTDEAIVKEALKYKTRSEFQKGCVSAYNAAHKSGRFDELCPHLPQPIKKDYICESIEDAISLARKCNNRTELKEEYGKAYEMLRTQRLLDKACSHMKKYKRPVEKWTKEERAKAAASCKTRKEFHNKYSWAHYLACQNEGELDEICSHMPKPNRWTEETLKELASQCSCMQDLKALNYEAYKHVTHKKGKSSFVRKYFKKPITD